VVAQEVRILASRSSDASKEIRALIDTSVQHTESGAKLVRSAGDLTANSFGSSTFNRCEMKRGLPMASPVSF
tara:strand:+ start:1197 stop:1412 length:216 start_codon:yes stop_codon:yes gene_type:complete